MAQEALMTVVKRDLLDERTIENEICIAIEHLSYTSRDEHLRNANISVSSFILIYSPFSFYNQYFLYIKKCS